ncbi:MAG: AAA family ATPase, partial [Acidimicrobiia bacterium]
LGFPIWVAQADVLEARERGLSVVAVADPAEPALSAMTGITTLNPGTDLGEILRTCAQRAAMPPQPRPAKGATGRCLAVWGAKGGPGKSTIAFELASALSDCSGSVVLVDGDPYGGDLMQLAGITDEIPSIVWAARMAGKGELNEETIRRSFGRMGKGGAILLPGLPRPSLWADVSIRGWVKLINVLGGIFRWLVIDAGFCFEPDPAPFRNEDEGRNSMTRRALTSADQIVAVCRSDPIGMKQFLWGFEALSEIVNTENVVVVANRVARQDRADVIRLLERHTGASRIHVFPDRPDLVRDAALAGRAIFERHKNSDLGRAIAELCDGLGARPPARGFMSRLARGA